MNGRDPRGGRPGGGTSNPTAGDRPDPAHMDRIALPRLNPWLALLILVLLGFGYIGLWGRLLGG